MSKHKKKSSVNVPLLVVIAVVAGAGVITLVSTFAAVPQAGLQPSAIGEVSGNASTATNLVSENARTISVKQQQALEQEVNELRAEQESLEGEESTEQTEER